MHVVVEGASALLVLMSAPFTTPDCTTSSTGVDGCESKFNAKYSRGSKALQQPTLAAHYRYAQQEPPGTGSRNHTAAQGQQTVSARI